MTDSNDLSTNTADDLLLDDEKSADNAIPVAMPEIAPPEKQEPKKRGRKPYPRDKDGKIIRPDGSTSKASVRNSATGQQSATEVLTNEMVGKSINGMFMVSGIVLGPHMRLFGFEEKAVGDALGPLARQMPEVYKQIMVGLTALPVAMAVLGPRIVVSGLVLKKAIPKVEARKALLASLSMMEAEKLLSLESIASENEVALKQMAQAAMQVQATQVHPEQKKDGETL